MTHLEATAAYEAQIAHLRLLLAVLLKRSGEKQTITDDDFAELKRRVTERRENGNIVLELEAED